MPPTPTPAMFSLSLGGVKPRPRTCRGTMAHAAPPAATFPRNARREISFFLLMGILLDWIMACRRGPRKRREKSCRGRRPRVGRGGSAHCSSVGAQEERQGPPREDRRQY